MGQYSGGFAGIGSLDLEVEVDGEITASRVDGTQHPGRQHLGPIEGMTTILPSVIPMWNVPMTPDGYPHCCLGSGGTAGLEPVQKLRASSAVLEREAGGNCPVGGALRFAGS